MDGSSKENRLPIQAVHAMDQMSGQFRRKLRRCAIELAAARKATVTPDLVQEAVQIACNAMATLDDDENHERRVA
jgi:hypothetical protein